MIARQMILQRLGSLSDQELLQILAQAQGMGGDMAETAALGQPMSSMGGSSGFKDPNLAALNYDETRDGIKGWSNVTIERQKDNRPNLTEKNYIVEKAPVQNVLHFGEMPTDTGENAYMGAG